MKIKSRRMQEVEYAMGGRCLEDYLREQIATGASVPAIAARMNREFDLRPPIAITTLYHWLRMLQFRVGRAVAVPAADGEHVHFVRIARRRS